MMNFFDRLKRLLGGGTASPETSSPGDGASGTVNPITCMEALERVHEYLDGELDSVSHEEVAQHFAMCKRCYPHLELEEKFREALHRSQSGEVCPDHVKAQVMDLLARETGEKV